MPSVESGVTVKDSGAYRQGYCNLPSVRLAPGGSYIVVLSTYTQRPVGSFRLNIFSQSSKVRCEAIAAEGAGMNHRRVDGNFTSGLHQGQKGGVKLYPKLDRLVITPTGSPVQVRIVARLRATEGALSLPLHLGLFDNDPAGAKHAWGPRPESPGTLACTHKGTFFDSSAGVMLEYTGMWPAAHNAGLALIPSCFDEGSAAYHLDIYTSCTVAMRWEKQQ